MYLKNNRLYKYTLKIIPALGFLVIWEFIVHNSQELKFLFGSPLLVLNTLKTEWLEGQIFKDTLITFLETLIGFIIGNALGILLGLTLSYYESLAKISKPYIIALGSIPIFALAPMMIIWFGVGFFAKVMMVVFSTFLITAVQAYNGAQSVENEYKQLFTSFGANRLQYYIKAIIPSSLIWVLTSLKITVGFALLGAFIGEFISSENGLGRLIIKAGSLYNMPLVIVGLLHIIIIALFLNYLVDQLEKYFIKRKYKIIDN